MAGFLDSETQIIDMVLTSRGKLLLSNGVLNFVYWAAFDDEVNYDPLVMGSNTPNMLYNGTFWNIGSASVGNISGVVPPVGWTTWTNAPANYGPGWGLNYAGNWTVGGNADPKVAGPLENNTAYMTLGVVASQSSGMWVEINQSIPVVSGVQYIASAYLAPSNCEAYVGFAFYDVTGSRFTTGGRNNDGWYDAPHLAVSASAGDRKYLSSYTRSATSGTAPSGAFSMLMYVDLYRNSGSMTASYLLINRALVEAKAGSSASSWNFIDANTLSSIKSSKTEDPLVREPVQGYKFFSKMGMDTCNVNRALITVPPGQAIVPSASVTFDSTSIVMQQRPVIQSYSSPKSAAGDPLDPYTSTVPLGIIRFGATSTRVGVEYTKESFPPENNLDGFYVKVLVSGTDAFTTQHHTLDENSEIVIGADLKLKPTTYGG